MNKAGGTFKLSVTDAPPPEENVDSIIIFERVGVNLNQVAVIPQPTGEATLTSVPAGAHSYVAAFHNVAGIGPYSNEVAVTVIAIPTTSPNLVFALA